MLFSVSGGQHRVPACLGCCSHREETPLTHSQCGRLHCAAPRTDRDPSRLRPQSDPRRFGEDDMTGASGSVARMEVERTAFGNDAVTLQHVGEAEEGVCTSPHKDLVPCSGWKARSPHEHRRVLR
mmetsp:Transcript_21912/g.47671  ORF Transcript_21912/g.47671 Transcript_21912/m.47671 type:complete len:125 (+) Transcript_21912:21-395(+)